jgi:hypothetical protein
VPSPALPVARSETAQQSANLLAVVHRDFADPVACDAKGENPADYEDKFHLRARQNRHGAVFG